MVRRVRRYQRGDRNVSAGGTLIAVKDTFITTSVLVRDSSAVSRTTSVPELHNDCEIVWCKLELVGHKSIYLSSYYNPRTSNEESINQFGLSMEQASRTNNAFVMVSGDFNLPGWDWKSNTPKPNTSTQYINIHHKFTG